MPPPNRCVLVGLKEDRWRAQIGAPPESDGGSDREEIANGAPDEALESIYDRATSASSMTAHCVLQPRMAGNWAPCWERWKLSLGADFARVVRVNSLAVMAVKAAVTSRVTGLCTLRNGKRPKGC